MKIQLLFVLFLLFIIRRNLFRMRPYNSPVATNSTFLPTRNERNDLVGRCGNGHTIHAKVSSIPWKDQCEWHRINTMTGPDCVVMCNLINIHTHTYTLRSKVMLRCISFHSIDRVCSFLDLIPRQREHTTLLLYVYVVRSSPLIPHRCIAPSYRTLFLILPQYRPYYHLTPSHFNYCTIPRYRIINTTSTARTCNL